MQPQRGHLRVRAARPTLGDRLLEASLFGSRAGAREQRYAIYDLAYDIGSAHGVDLAPLVIEAPQFAELQARERALARAIEEDGIPV